MKYTFNICFTCSVIRGKVFNHTFISERNIFWLLLLSVVLLQLYAIIPSDHTMMGGDEGIYYNAAKLYAAAGEAFANHCIAKNLSPLGSYNWYGQFWSVFYGVEFRLFGSGTGILIFNLSYSLLAIIAIIKLIPKNNSQPPMRFILKQI